jgi:putative FmdB family regulatory protein
MPLYEYICEGDGEIVELLRPMADADKPVDDPRGTGRVFKRRHSTFATGGASAGQGDSPGAESRPACCPCGKMPGSCRA